MWLHGTAWHIMAQHSTAWCECREENGQQPWQVNPEQSHQQQQSTWVQAKQWIGKGWRRFCMVVNLPTASALAGKTALICCDVMCGVQTGRFRVES